MRLKNELYWRSLDFLFKNVTGVSFLYVFSTIVLTDLPNNKILNILGLVITFFTFLWIVNAYGFLTYYDDSKDDKDFQILEQIRKEEKMYRKKTRSKR